MKCKGWTNIGLGIVNCTEEATYIDVCEYDYPVCEKHRCPRHAVPIKDTTEETPT